MRHVELKVTSRSQGDHTIMSVLGEIDLYTAPTLQSQLTSALAPGQVKLIVDMSGVDFCDSTGINVLLAAHRQAIERGGELQLASPGSATRKVLQVTGLESVFTVVDEPSEPSRDRFGEVLAMARAADASGLSALWVAEHHFHTGGGCPAPPVLLAAAAATTHRLRVGALVSVLPFHDPVDVAEQYAMVDRVSGGRLNMGVGSGYIASELEGFHVDPATKQERFDRALETIRAAWAGRPVRPAHEAGAEVVLNVRPVQQPHPPLWIAVQRRAAIPHVARKSVSVALVPYATTGGLEELAEEVREFRAAVPAGAASEVAVALHLYAGDGPETARASLQRYLDRRLATQSRFYQEKVRADPRHASARTIEESGFALFGKPVDVASRLEEFRRIGVDEVVGIFDFGGLPHEAVLASIRALGETMKSSAPAPY